MSVPGLVVLYGGVMQKRWSVNSMMMSFIAFALVLVVWVLFGFKMAFGSPMHIFGADSGFFANLLGKPGSVLSAHDYEQGQAVIPLITTGPAFHFPTSTLAYFQFVFAAITPILMLGSVLGRINFKAWIPFVLLWSSLIYTVNAFLIWGGGWWAQHGAVDYSGGYVIHLAAGVSGFVAAAVIGPRLQRDREIDAPNNLLMVATGAGLLWLGWNGFNGGDPYYAGADASAAVLNTNLCTAVAFLVWVGWDYTTGHKPSLIGSVNGMITGLVAITPAAGYVNGWGAMAIGVIGSTIVYFALNYLSRMRPFRKVDDTLGVDLHARLRRPRRRPADRRVRRPAHDRLPGPGQDSQHLDRRPDPRQRDAAQVAGARGAVGDRVLGDRDVHPAQAGRPLRAAADERGGHGGGRPRRARPRGLPVRRAVAQLPVGCAARAPGREGSGASGEVDC